jgi:neutral amino acid transport system permease protein
VNLMAATLIATVLGGAFGWLLDAALFAPLRRRGTSLVAQLVFTIGLAIFLRYFFLFIFGGRNRFYGDYTAQQAMDLGPVVITAKDLVAMGVTIVVLVAVGFGLQRTRFGKAMRAVADNGDLAASSGIDVQRVIRLVWVAGGALAALGGVCIALSEQVSWLIGFRVLLLIFAGVVLGGLGTAFGALVGCVLIGMGIQLSTIFLPIELKNVGALVVLILVLLVRPQGILGRAERIG